MKCLIQMITVLLLAHIAPVMPCGNNPSRRWFHSSKPKPAACSPPEKPTSKYCVRNAGYLNKMPKPRNTPQKNQEFSSYSCSIDVTLLTTYSGSREKLYEIPKDIPPNVTQLQIINNCLRTIKADVFKHLQNMYKLDLSFNQIEIISLHAFRGLSKLKCLDLRQNMLTCLVSGSFSGLTSLENLYLTSNMLKSLGNETFAELKSLKILKMDINSLVAPSIESGTFQNLAVLVHFDLSRNMLGVLSGSNKIFQALNSLKSLELERSKIEGIELGLFNVLKQLEFLNLHGNKIKEIKCGSFDELQQLKVLNLLDNDIKVIETGAFDGLKQLTLLNLGQNFYFQGDTDFFKQLTELRYLFLSKSRPVLVDNSFKGLQNLLHLDISDIRLKEINKNSFNGLIMLQKLNLSNNRVQVIKRHFFTRMRTLTELDLSDNSISTIEDGLFQELKNLRRLYLQNNKFLNISKDTLKGLHTLEFLNVENRNKLDIQPKTLGKVVLNNGTIILSTKALTGWNLFIDQQGLNRSRKFQSKVWRIVHTINIDPLDPNKVTFIRSFCWMKHAMEMGWLHVDTYCRMTYRMVITRKCTFQPMGCPETNMCMEYDEAKCKAACKEGSISELIRDYEVCPFQYWCKCTCPEFIENSCESECAGQGQFPATRITDSGCRTCSCLCPMINCTDECFDYQFEIFNNTFGCQECSCICPDNKCDEGCNGTGLGIPGPVDEAGCSTSCAGCITFYSNGTTREVHTTSNNSNNMMVLMIATVIALLFASTLCAMFFRRKFMAQGQPEEPEEEDKSELNYLLSKLNEDLGKQVEECWIDPNNLRIFHLLGNGNFGIVWSGRLTQGPVKETEVAIKKIKGTYKDGYKGKIQLKTGNDFDILVEKIRVEVEIENKKIEDFLQEAVIMRKFNHPNVLSLIGISTHGDRPCAVLPLMTNGDLKKYLNKNHCRNTVKDLLVFSLGVTEGMEHIAEQQFVHRDLAARNCMLDSDLMVKIADFGLTRSLQEEDYYQIDSKRRALPVRWMSLEALKEGVFTLKNDVWSFGVLLWEIFTYGEHPYAGIDNEDIIYYLKLGKRLQQPEICPDFIYKMMTECWSENPEKRPTFTDLRIRLNDFADSKAEYMKMSDGTTMQ